MFYPITSDGLKYLIISVEGGNSPQTLFFAIFLLQILNIMVFYCIAIPKSIHTIGGTVQYIVVQPYRILHCLSGSHAIPDKAGIYCRYEYIKYENGGI
jgi:hypothetical protein